MESFPYESWEEAFAAAQGEGEAFFTFGPGGNATTIFLTILGAFAMFAALALFVIVERRSLEAHAQKFIDEGVI